MSVVGAVTEKILNMAAAELPYHNANRKEKKGLSCNVSFALPINFLESNESVQRLKVKFFTSSLRILPFSFSSN